jgi:hypothetical protein
MSLGTTTTAVQDPFGLGPGSICSSYGNIRVEEGVKIAAACGLI